MTRRKKSNARCVNFKLDGDIDELARRFLLGLEGIGINVSLTALVEASLVNLVGQYLNIDNKPEDIESLMATRGHIRNDWFEKNMPCKMRSSDDWRLRMKMEEGMSHIERLRYMNRDPSGNSGCNGEVSGCDSYSTKTAVTYRFDEKTKARLRDIQEEVYADTGDRISMTDIVERLILEGKMTAVGAANRPSEGNTEG